ncbi:serine hydrolase domain-containing protein [Streptomyces sp. NPDC047315]|uniref:serine hydrolase domain-containing protein n=1 Tax=Streptomyces sp. NPDC047315 TaxID=3155142 RepID=UPI0033CC8D88
MPLYLPPRSGWRRAAAAVLPLLFCLLAVPPPAAAAPEAPSPSSYAELDAYVRERMAATDTPGLSYAVVGPDGPLHQRSWGTDGRGDRVTADTPFLWGSVAKPIAATAVLALVEEGRLGLDDPVVDHLPGFRFGGRDHASRVTVRHLLTQTAGVPNSATLKVTDCLDADCPRPGERVGALDDVTPLGPPGAAYAYSSANYLLLAAVVEAATGRSFADELRRTVLAPAGMSEAIVDRESARARRLAPGHQLLWGMPAATADGVDDHGAAYGYTGGDLDDLAAFASFQLRAAAPVLAPDSVRLMRQEGKAGSGYGLGWRVGGLDAPLEKAVWHTGASPGYAAMLFLLPEQGVALVLQQNLYGLLQDETIMEVGFGAARMLAGAPRPDGSPSATVHHLTVWTTTALAVLLLAATTRSLLLLRRPAHGPGRGPARRHGWLPTALWCLLAALPLVALWLLARAMPLGQAWTWVPDATVALYVAAAAGVALLVVRGWLTFRSRRGGHPVA